MYKSERQERGRIILPRVEWDKVEFKPKKYNSLQARAVLGRTLPQSREHTDIGK